MLKDEKKRTKQSDTLSTGHFLVWPRHSCSHINLIIKTYKNRCRVIFLVGPGLVDPCNQFHRDLNFMNILQEIFLTKATLHRSSYKKVFWKICSKFTGEHPCWSVISIIEIALQHGCCPVNLLHIFRTPFPENISGWLLLRFENNTHFSIPGFMHCAKNEVFH